MMVEALRIGFAGANADRGWARDAHLDAVRALPGVALHAISARSRELAEAAAAHFGARAAFDDSIEMVRDPDIDIVAVTVKVPEHRAIVLAALEAGKHVYCEWPLGRDLDEAEEMAAAAKKAGVHAAIGLQGANAHAVRKAAAIVAESGVGRPLHLRVVSHTGGWAETAPPHYAYLQDKRNGATLLSIAGGHTLAAVEAVAGPYESVMAQCSILHGKVRIAGTDTVVERTCADHVLVIGRHVNGCVSSVEIVGGASRSPLVFTLRGTDGTLSLQGAHAGGYQLGNLTVETSAGPVAMDVSLPEVTGPSLNVALLWERLESDIRTGRHTAPDFTQAVRVTRLLDAIERSSGEGRRIFLEQ